MRKQGAHVFTKLTCRESYDSGFSSPDMYLLKGFFSQMIK